jgi:DNA-binding GntR family transcriptional regulator
MLTIHPVECRQKIVVTMLRRTSKAKTPARTGRAPARPGEEAVYRSIYQAVLDHRLQPGTKLREVALAELFGVSRAVVRSALARLAYAKLVELTPHRGATVASPSVAESRDLFAARRAVEGAIVDALARRVTAAQARRLRALVARERGAYGRGETRSALKLSLDFHRELAAMAGNAVLADMLDHLIARTPLVVLSFQGRGGDSLCGSDDHRGIVEAIAAGHAGRAVAAMGAHLKNLENQLDLAAPAESRTDLAELLLPAAG